MGIVRLSDAEIRRTAVPYVYCCSLTNFLPQFVNSFKFEFLTLRALCSQSVSEIFLENDKVTAR